MHQSREKLQNYRWKCVKLYRIAFSPNNFIENIHKNIFWEENVEGDRVCSSEMRISHCFPTCVEKASGNLGCLHRPLVHSFLASRAESVHCVISRKRSELREKKWWADRWLGTSNSCGVREIKSTKVIYASWGSELATLVLATGQPKGWEWSSAVCK